MLSVRVFRSGVLACALVGLPRLKQSPRAALVELLSALVACALVWLPRLKLGDQEQPLKTCNSYRQHWLCQTLLGLFRVH